VLLFAGQAGSLAFSLGNAQVNILHKQAQLSGLNFVAPLAL
jgi:hypothetical protein